MTLENEDRQKKLRGFYETTEGKARLWSVLVAAAIDESRKAMNAVFFQLCKNVAVATNGRAALRASHVCADPASRSSRRRPPHR
jgi:hypothetical protein